MPLGGREMPILTQADTQIRRHMLDVIKGGLGEDTWHTLRPRWLSSAAITSTLPCLSEILRAVIYYSPR